MVFKMLPLAVLTIVCWHAAPAAAALATVYTKCNKANTVALTFDDGPYIYEQNIANKLHDAGIKATFFVNGNNWECIYDDAMISSMRANFAQGHEFGSHTWHHYDLATLAWDPIHDEMWRTELALQRILGVNPAMMRPPYGSYNDLVRSAASVRNQSLIIWDFDDGDSTGASVAQSQQDYTDLANRHPSNVLTLNHETYETTANNVLPFAITKLKNAGYQFATVSECLGIQPYQWVAGQQKKTSDWNCNT